MMIVVRVMKMLISMITLISSTYDVDSDANISTDGATAVSDIS